MTTILKTRDFAVSDLAEFIVQGLPPTNVNLRLLIRARIKLWLLANSVEEKQHKKKVKKPGKRKQIEMKL